MRTKKTHDGKKRSASCIPRGAKTSQRLYAGFSNRLVKGLIRGFTDSGSGQLISAVATGRGQCSDVWRGRFVSTSRVGPDLRIDFERTHAAAAGA